MGKKQVRILFLIFVLAFLIDRALISMVYLKSPIHEIQKSFELEKFCKMDISGENLLRIKKFCIEKDLDFPTYLSIYMLENDFSVQHEEEKLKIYKKNKKVNSSLKHFYAIIFNGIQEFPVKTNQPEDKNRYHYIDSFLAERTYGGNRKHMGTDIMDGENESSYFPIISMTDGIVENLGWLELGGYRIGVRSNSGAYFYYAHLASYAQGLKEGDEIKAGQILGYMGNTGYGKEGTKDQFDVHLHVGISLKIGEVEEMWVNPYPILKMIELDMN